MDSYASYRPLLEDLVCSASGTEGAESEWLYDVSWIVYGRVPAAGPNRIPINRAFRKLGLAAESEMEMQDVAIIHDFKKLMAARCDYRVFVFNKKSTAEVQQTFAWLEAEAHQFGDGTQGGRYLLCGLNSYDSGFLSYTTSKCERYKPPTLAHTVAPKSILSLLHISLHLFVAFYDKYRLLHFSVMIVTATNEKVQ